MNKNRKLLFATNNAHKVEEVLSALGGEYSVMTLNEYGIDGDIAETETTLEGNASLKAHYVASQLKGEHNITVFADDTGLEVEALGGAPGVYSARYSGGGAAQNIEKLLGELNGVENRRAQFRTVISVIEPDGREHRVEGIVHGYILQEVSPGSEGFGYDPIFCPQGFDLSFAQMSLEQKNAISHRGRAVAAMKQLLDTL